MQEVSLFRQVALEQAAEIARQKFIELVEKELLDALSSNVSAQTKGSSSKTSAGTPVVKPAVPKKRYRTKAPG